LGLRPGMRALAAAERPAIGLRECRHERLPPTGDRRPDTLQARLVSTTADAPRRPGSRIMRRLRPDSGASLAGANTDGEAHQQAAWTREPLRFGALARNVRRRAKTCG